MKKIPQRKCVACGSMLEKDKLFRLVKSEDGIFLDKTYKVQCRGAYVCKKRECVDLALKKKSFNRSFKQAVSDKVFDILYMELENDR
ncbi:MAG: YlxR family protein [Pseudobutyrivibrio sp.]|nr:YlxR family protein [Pseudobutyrivibrio sp.]